VWSIGLPTVATRTDCDDVFARARASRRSREPGADVAYRLLSRGAYPDGLADLVERLGTSDRDAVDAAIAWLTLDPFCLWSGYAKGRLMRRLAAAKLSTRQAAKVRAVLIDVIQRGPRQEFRDTCRLARAVNSEELRAELRRLEAHPDAGTRERAIWMLGSCERAAAPR
jgi:hypothetical protein